MQPDLRAMSRGLRGKAAGNAGAIVAGGVLLIWPALANGYPLLFSDTGSFLEQLLRPIMIWDKPWVYGPVLVLVSLRSSLWLPVLAQGLLVSWVLWLVQGVFRTASPGWHLGLCLGLALGSAAAWFTALLMPDILAPLTVLLLFLLGLRPGGRSRWLVTALASFAIAAHLTHLVIATACVMVVLVLRPRAVGRVAAPLAVALALLLATNLAGHGKLAVSPYGSVFGLARLVADGPAQVYLAQRCPAAGYRMCAWVGRFPGDADTFLWDPNGPVWGVPGGPIALAPEASRIVVGTIVSQPAAVARAALSNTLRQLFTLRLGAVIGKDWLDQAVGAELRAHYPIAEQGRFGDSRQRTDGLRAIAAPWQGIHMTLLVLGAVGSLVLLARSWRRDGAMVALIALIVASVLSNAFATGALSGPHDRYQARIAWLVLLPPMLWGMRRRWDCHAVMPKSTDRTGGGLTWR